MSGQTYAGPDDPLYLSTRGVNNVSFTKQSAPPLAYLNKGILYELDDGVLYFNAEPLSGAATAAAALKTTGANVNVALAAPPSVDQVLTATSATTATWQTPAAPTGGEFIDDATFIVDSVDATTRIAFDVVGTASTTLTLATAQSSNRKITFPDATDTLVGKATTDVLTGKTITDPSNNVSANSIKSSGPDIEVASAGQPVAGQVLMADTTESAIWQWPGAEMLDTETFIVDAVDTSKRIGFDVTGTTGMTTTIKSAAIADNFAILPNVDCGLLGALDQIPPDVVPTADVTGDGFAVKPSGGYLVASDTDTRISLLTNSNTTAFSNGLAIGSKVLNGGATTDLTQSVVLGSRLCENIVDVGSSVVIGDAHWYQGAVGQNVSGHVIIGDSFASAGNYVTSFGNVAIGSNIGAAITSGDHNTLVGTQVCQAITTASDNIVLGYTAGSALTTNDNNIIIGHTGVAAANDEIRIGTLQTKAFIAGIRGVTTAQVDAIPVLVDSAGQLGTVSSSIKYKENVRDLDHAAILHKLRPVSFNYIGQEKQTIGLIAEEVEKVYPAMCVYQPVEMSVACQCDDCVCAEAMGDARLHEDKKSIERELLTVDYARLSILLLGEVQALSARLARLESA